MAVISRDRIKKRGVGRFFRSFKYSIEGLIYAYRNEQSVLLHLLASITIICIGLILNINDIEWTIIALSLAIVLVVELFNTAIEAIVDMITLEVSPLAKIAKDCGSAATFVVSIITLIIVLSIFVPYVLALFT